MSKTANDGGMPPRWYITVAVGATLDQARRSGVSADELQRLLDEENLTHRQLVNRLDDRILAPRSPGGSARVAPAPSAFRIQDIDRAFRIGRIAALPSVDAGSLHYWHAHATVCSEPRATRRLG